MIKKLYLFVIAGIFSLNFLYALPNPQDQRVQKIYEHVQDQLIWIQNGEWSSCGRSLLEALSHVDEEGLWKEDYAPYVEALQRANLNTPDKQKKADSLLTLAALNYIADMRGERLNPHTVDNIIHINPVAANEVELLKGYLSVPNQCGWIHGIAPSSPEYAHLKQLLSLYRQKQAQGGWPQLPKGTKLHIGDKGQNVETLRAQLIAQEVLPSQGQGSDVFDESLEEALKHYQTLHGLEPDGKVGGSTLVALNMPVEERIQSIVANLERLRWFPNPLPTRYIQVNVPGFYLKAVDGGIPAFFMPIITGKEYTKTPVFNAPMTEIIFNPSWHVPASIVPELLPKIQRNPEAYARKGYHITEGSSIVQSPGNANALGKIRFTIDSPFSIYLHGTPQKNLFDKVKRSFSHGCIRVQDPTKLAEFVFHDPEKWTHNHIQKEASGSTTKRVKLDQPLPVFVTYFTVFEDENHNMHFVEDEYHQDKKVLEALENAKRKSVLSSPSL
jgi:murein L,D-transpeptidase YcbB/YkuD